ncbi:DUF1285 domain-containing protein [Polycladidibacter hongkongensis]|uniref:DUF1285 domain-containing protein n=1 Tax=Polycladidibacter hongkongensis TaxID=1647556 RepID=UPI00083100C6|nr:DUF1285 domain-containing protein [Pseudovibrio hongkongensis]
MQDFPAALQGLLSRGADLAAAPVDAWDPPDCGDIDMCIRADGSWQYCGSGIGREALVRLFAKVLRRERDGRYVLVTPAEKVGIHVEDAPFLAVEMARQPAKNAKFPGVLVVRTNLDELVEVDEDHPLRFARAEDGGFRAYVMVRRGLEAAFSRSLMFDLVEELVEHAGGLCLRSGDYVESVGPEILREEAGK